MGLYWDNGKENGDYYLGFKDLGKSLATLHRLNPLKSRNLLPSKPGSP